MSTNRKVKPLAQFYQADANYIALRVSTDTQDVNAEKMEVLSPSRYTFGYFLNSMPMRGVR